MSHIASADTCLLRSRLHSVMLDQSALRGLGQNKDHRVPTVISTPVDSLTPRLDVRPHIAMLPGGNLGQP